MGATNDGGGETVTVTDETFEDPWRVACPKGHPRVTAADTTSTGYCDECDQSYPYSELQDRREETVYLQ